MSKIGDGYGSEWHLLNYLGYHRNDLSHRVLDVVGGENVQWLDFPVKADHATDAEWKGIDFLPPDHLARKDWITFWPQTGNSQNWDAVGKISGAAGDEWLLVEAKAHVKEIESECGAKARGGLGQITTAFETVKKDLGISLPIEDWLRPYYQFANRLAALWFLQSHGIPARLLFIYFTGDSTPNCPETPTGWNNYLDSMKRHLGLDGKTRLEQHVHKLFLPALHRQHGK